MEPNYKELAIGAYRDAMELAVLGHMTEANRQIANADRYARLAIESAIRARTNP